MFKLKLLNAALAVALGLGFGIATAQTDQAAQHGNALDKPSNKADQTSRWNTGQAGRAIGTDRTAQSRPVGTKRAARWPFRVHGASCAIGHRTQLWR